MSKNSSKAAVAAAVAPAAAIGNRPQRMQGVEPAAAPAQGAQRPVTVESVFGPAVGRHEFAPPMKGQLSITYHNGLLMPEVAISFAEDLHYPNQRSVGEADVQAYSGMLQKGNFLPSTTLIVGTVKGSDREYLLDGQTRVRSVAKAGIPMFYCIHKIQFATWEAMGAYGFTLDNGRKRSFADNVAFSNKANLLALKWTKQENSQLRSVQTVWSNRFLGYSNKFYKARPDGAQLLDNVDNFLDEMKIWVDMLRGARRPELKGTLERLRRGATPAAFFVLALKAKPQEAKQFFDNLLCHEGLEPNHPCPYLARFLDDWKCDQVRPHIMAYHIHRAWNAFLTGNHDYRYSHRETVQEIGRHEKQNRNLPSSEMVWPIGLPTQQACSAYDVNTGTWVCREEA